MDTLPTPYQPVRIDNRAPLLSSGRILQQRYCIVRELGSGGMGAVYEAVDQRLEARVAIKETFAVDDRLRRQFEQEARLLAQLHHPSLPRVSDYFTEEGRAFLVMQFVCGDDLARVIAQQTEPFPQPKVIAWADQLLDALIYLHASGRQIIHRDIKPHNLKLTESGQIALLDFGLAKTHALDNSTTQSSNSIFGYTRRYSPLEQIQDQGTSPQSDIYALGATLYHLLTGCKPPDALARAAALANSEPDPLRPADEVHQVVGPNISAMLNKAMALNAADRFRSAIEFREVLRRVGRLALDQAHDSDLASLPAKDTASLKTTVVPPGIKTDPFDSYSILKPDQDVFRLAKPKRSPAIVTVALAIVLITVTVSYPGGLMDSVARLWGAARATPVRDVTGSSAIHQSKPEAISSKAAPVIKVNSISSALTANRKEEPQKQRARRPLSKPGSVKPPRFSIAP